MSRPFQTKKQRLHSLTKAQNICMQSKRGRLKIIHIFIRLNNADNGQHARVLQTYLTLSFVMIDVINVAVSFKLENLPQHIG